MGVFVSTLRDDFESPTTLLLPDAVIDVETTALHLSQRSPGEPVAPLSIDAKQLAKASDTVELPAQAHPAGHAVELPVYVDVRVTGAGHTEASRIRLAPGSIVSNAVALTLGLIS